MAVPRAGEGGSRSSAWLKKPTSSYRGRIMCSCDDMDSRCPASSSSQSGTKENLVAGEEAYDKSVDSKCSV